MTCMVRRDQEPFLLISPFTRTGDTIQLSAPEEEHGVVPVFLAPIADAWRQT